jgi:cysteine desulfurase
MRAYLDYNATAPLRPEARASVLAALDLAGNPSSIHAEGRAARALIEDARREIASMTGAQARDVVFGSGGTEAATLALAPGVSAPGVAPLTRLIVGAVEHPCVAAGHRFAAAEIAPVTPDGRLDLEALERLRAETGADALFVSAHKFGGPKGAGALAMLREGLSIPPLLRGGGQERGRRAGTENVAALAGFGAAAKAALAGLAEEGARAAALRDVCQARLYEIAPDAMVFGEGAPRLPNTLAFAIPDVPAATLLMRLDLEGAAVSSGSACSSGKVGPSTVLAAMGVSPALAAGAIRVSFGWASRREDVEIFAAALGKALARRRASGA